MHDLFQQRPIILTAGNRRHCRISQGKSEALTPPHTRIKFQIVNISKKASSLRKAAIKEIPLPTSLHACPFADAVEVS